MASWISWSLALTAIASTAAAAPMRPLPAPSSRAIAAGPAYFVDAGKGDDAADGSKPHPWKTVQAAVKRLKPGDTLYLRGGTYFEAVALTARGTAAAPITIRAMPGELAILDAGLREFQTDPKASWEPAGTPGEFRSVHAFPAIAKDADRGRGVWALGNFADSMIPLHGYRFAEDLRATNQLWTIAEKDAPGTGIYVGPGVWLDWATHKLHARLAPTQVNPANYDGEADPRKLALVIGVDRSALAITGSAHVRIQDLVLRGSAVSTVEITKSSHVELDGVTIYGGAPALRIASTDHGKLVRSALRGTAAPWSSRASMKYRGISPYLLVFDGTAPSRDWEIAYSDFTDGHDGLVLDSLHTLRFHHNRVDNFNDDAIYLTLPPRAAVPEDVQLYENLVTRAYTALAFSENTHDGKAGPNPIGPGVYLFRNVFDLRDGTYGWIPKDATPATLLASRMCGDHGSPIWEPLFFYQNTVINPGPAYRDYYGLALAMATRGTQRRLFNNLFLQIDGNPGLNLPSLTDDLQADGNWFWGLRAGAAVQGDFFAKRKAPELGAHDRFGDPKLAHLVDGDPALDVRPTRGGVIDAGVALPAAWPDSLRASDRGKPDVGALPAGAPMLQVGPAARRP